MNSIKYHKETNWHGYSMQVNDRLRQKQEVPSQELEINYWNTHIFPDVATTVLWVKENRQGLNDGHAPCDLQCNIPLTWLD